MIYDLWQYYESVNLKSRRLGIFIIGKRTTSCRISLGWCSLVGQRRLFRDNKWKIKIWCKVWYGKAFPSWLPYNIILRFMSVRYLRAAHTNQPSARDDSCRAFHNVYCIYYFCYFYCNKWYYRGESLVKVLHPYVAVKQKNEGVDTTRMFVLSIRLQSYILYRHKIRWRMSARIFLGVMIV